MVQFEPAEQGSSNVQSHMEEASFYDPTKAIDELCDALFFEEQDDPASLLSEEDLGFLQDIVVEL